MFTVDCDIHVNDTPGALAPFCEMPWRLSLEALDGASYPYLQVPGFAPNFRLDPPIAGSPPYRSVSTPEEMRLALDTLGIDVGILFPDHLLLFAALPLAEYAVALGQAYNRWLTEFWLTSDNGLYGALLACPQDPAASARQIAEFGKNSRIAAIYLPTAGVNPLWGHRMYDPIFAAAEAHDLPVVFHSVTIVSPVFPCQLEQFENHFARQMLSHSFAMMANLVSLMHTGVPARFPTLRTVFTEAGIAWMPYMAWRMDKYHHEYRRHVPILTRRPSEYLRERFWVSTQPIEEPDAPEHLVETIGHIGDDRVVFASDWPHHDFDHPKALLNLPMPRELKRKIMGENALKVFTRIAGPEGFELRASSSELEERRPLEAEVV